MADLHIGVFTVFLALAGYFIIYDTPEKVGNWLSDEEKRFLSLRHKYSAGGDNGIAEKEEFSWKAAKLAFSVYQSLFSL